MPSSESRPVLFLSPYQIAKSDDTTFAQGEYLAHHSGRSVIVVPGLDKLLSYPERCLVEVEAMTGRDNFHDAGHTVVFFPFIGDNPNGGALGEILALLHDRPSSFVYRDAACQPDSARRVIFDYLGDGSIPGVQSRRAPSWRLELRTLA
ncbi:hypothetical protein KW785_02955 [Candidatus Parcubacteria bacterium]|nr:hypothetical protein [Candidatus Parcubacteria bacterium]